MSSKDRRRSEKLDKNAPGIVTLTVSPDKLRAIFPDSYESPVSNANANADSNNDNADADTDGEALTPAPSTPLPSKDEDASPENKTTAAVAKDDNASESTPATPNGNATAAADTPASSSTMAPPTGTAAAAATAAAATETPAAVTPAPADNDSSAAANNKKKGSLKRTAAAAGVDGTASGPGSANGDTPQPPARVRSKPGPKKKAKLYVPLFLNIFPSCLLRILTRNSDDGVEIKASAAGAHKLGPKASMGAINAGLRALDRSGKPCRKWAKGSFQLKSFTGVQWSIPRWRAPPKTSANTDTEGGETTSATASADGSNKENGGTNNKEANGAIGTDKKDDKDQKDQKDQKEDTKANGHTNGDVTAAPTPSDVEMAGASAVPSPSVEPATEAATPVAAAA